MGDRGRGVLALVVWVAAAAGGCDTHGTSWRSPDAGRDAGRPRDSGIDVGLVGTGAGGSFGTFFDAGVDRFDGGSLSLRTLQLTAEHLLYDPGRARLYATVQGNASAYPNSLVVIDPGSWTVIAATPIGSDPDTMALSADGSTLWLGIDGANAVRRVDLTSVSMQAGPLHPVPSGSIPGYAAHAGPMVALPESPSALAVSTHYFGLSPSFAGAVVFDDGVARPMATPGHTGAARLCPGPPGLLFGFNNLHTGFGFYVLTVMANGLAQTEHDGLVSGFDTDIVYSAADARVYATSGEVVDVSNPAAPVRAGTFRYAGLVLPRGGERVLMLSPPGFTTTGMSGTTLRLLDGATFTEIGEAPIPQLDSDSALELVAVGTDAVAVVGGTDVYLLRHDLIR